MKHWYQKPHPLLTDHIRTVLILEGFSYADTNDLPLFTNGMPALLYQSAKDEQGNEQIVQLTLFGKSAPADCWEIKNNTTVIAYFFKPFALPVLFNTPAATISKTPLALSVWSPHKANALKTQLLYAGSTAQKVEALDSLLIQQLQQQCRECAIIRYATDQMMMNTGTEVLTDILKTLNLTERTFQRIFKKYVGITASQYRRICQFQGSFSQLQAQDFDKLTDIAYDNGFADQSHFIRSFKEFTQTTPNDYLRSGLPDKEE